MHTITENAKHEISRWHKSRQALSCAAILLLLAGCGQSAPAANKKEDTDSQAGVNLTPDQIKVLGISTTPARAAVYRQSVAGYGVVIALETFAQTDADIETAAAAAAQSAAAAARARSLSTGDEAAVSQEIVEAAQSKATADAAALNLAERKLQSVFGLDAPWKTPAERKAVMAKLANGRAVLVRVNFPLGMLGGLQPQEISVSRIGNATQAWTTRTIWSAPADPNLPGNGYYCLVEGSNLKQNEHLIASVHIGPQKKGVWIPQTAVLISESSTWIYVEPTPGHFVRVQVSSGEPDGNGLFLSHGIGVAPGEKTVTGAAGLLLAREINPSSSAED